MEGFLKWTYYEPGQPGNQENRENLENRGSRENWENFENLENLENRENRENQENLRLVLRFSRKGSLIAQLAQEQCLDAWNATWHSSRWAGTLI